MSENIVALADRRKPVVYTVEIRQHWDDTLEVFVHDVADDERSRASVGDALHRAARMFFPADKRHITNPSGLRGEVLAEDEGVAWVKWPAGNRTFVHLADFPTEPTP